MSEEIKTEVKTEEVKTEETVETKQTEASAEPSPLEKRATEQGWQPLEEWVAAGNAADDWRDARSFLDRGELLNRISQQSKEMKELRKTLKDFQEHNKKLAETKFKEKLDSLKVEKKEALESGDAARVVEIDEQIDLVRDTLAEHKAEAATPEPVTPEVPPEFQRWVDRNSWYAQNPEMREFADNIGTAYAKNNRNKTPVEVLQYVEQRVRKTYSEMFTNPARNAPNTVEAGSTRGAATRSKSDPAAALPPEAVEVMNRLVRSGVMTKEEYIKQYNTMKG